MGKKTLSQHKHTLNREGTKPHWARRDCGACQCDGYMVYPSRSIPLENPLSYKGFGLDLLFYHDLQFIILSIFLSSHMPMSQNHGSIRVLFTTWEPLHVKKNIRWYPPPPSPPPSMHDWIVIYEKKGGNSKIILKLVIDVAWVVSSCSRCKRQDHGKTHPYQISLFLTNGIISKLLFVMKNDQHLSTCLMKDP